MGMAMLAPATLKKGLKHSIIAGRAFRYVRTRKSDQHAHTSELYKKTKGL